MKALLLIAMILVGAIGSIVAQKKSTIMGDIVIGELTGRDEATREITIKYHGIFGMGQSGGPKFEATPDGFMGLTLNVTTIEDTEARLGPPDVDKVDSLDASKLAKWLDPKHKEKIFRQLTYKKNPDFLEMKLSFLDGKLVIIDLAYRKRISPEKLRGLFRAEFALLGGPASLPDKPGQYPIDFMATHFPASYSMVAISDKTFIFVNCASEGGGSSPGRVERTRQISRTLEKKTS